MIMNKLTLYIWGVRERDCVCFLGGAENDGRKMQDMILRNIK